MEEDYKDSEDFVERLGYITLRKQPHSTQRMNYEQALKQGNPGP